MSHPDCSMCKAQRALAQHPELHFHFVIKTTNNAQQSIFLGNSDMQLPKWNDLMVVIRDSIRNGRNRIEFLTHIVTIMLALRHENSGVYSVYVCAKCDDNGSSDDDSDCFSTCKDSDSDFFETRDSLILTCESAILDIRCTFRAI